MMVEKNTSMINKSQIVHLRSLWHQTIQSLKFAGDFASVSPGEQVRLVCMSMWMEQVRYPARMSICQHKIILSCGKLWNNWTSQKREW